MTSNRWKTLRKEKKLKSKNISSWIVKVERAFHIRCDLTLSRPKERLPTVSPLFASPLTGIRHASETRGIVKSVVNVPLQRTLIPSPGVDKVISELLVEWTAVPDECAR